MLQPCVLVKDDGTNVFKVVSIHVWVTLYHKIELILFELLHGVLEIYELEWQEHGYSILMVSIYSLMFSNHHLFRRNAWLCSGVDIFGRTEI